MSGLFSAFVACLDRVIDWFMPQYLAGQREALQRARMFLLSHTLGPILGNVVPIYLCFIQPQFDYRILVLFCTITGFWVFPFLLRAGLDYTWLSLTSVQNLIFTIFWGCYFYGGVSSPFLPWLLTAPLLAFFYLGSAKKMRLAVLVMLTVNCGGFLALYLAGHAFPRDVPLSSLQGIGIASTLSASGYVTMMALYYAKILASQAEIEHEVREHMQTAANLRRIAADAERAAAAKGEFIAKMSHELRTPLNAVIGYSQMLLEDARGEGHASAALDLDRILTAGKQLLRIVNDVLDFSKVDAGKMELLAEAAEPAEWIAEAIAAGRAEAERRGLGVDVNIDANVGAPVLDTMLAGRVLSHLFDNAVKYTERGQVGLEVERRRTDAGEVIAFVVTDSGVGIEPERLPSLFDAFSGDSDNTTSKYGDGAGIGLALSRKLCRIMGGDITVRSRPGAGARFEVLLPELDLEDSDDDRGPSAASAAA